MRGHEACVKWPTSSGLARTVKRTPSARALAAPLSRAGDARGFGQLEEKGRVRMPVKVKIIGAHEFMEAQPPG